MVARVGPVSNSHFHNGHRLLFIPFYMVTPCYTIGSVVIREKTGDDNITLSLLYGDQKFEFRCTHARSKLAPKQWLFLYDGTLY